MERKERLKFRSLLVVGPDQSTIDKGSTSVVIIVPHLREHGRHGLGTVLSSLRVVGLSESRCTSFSLVLPVSLGADYAPTSEVGTIKGPPRYKYPWRKGQLPSLLISCENGISRVF